MSKIDKLLDAYWDMFEDMFPTMCYQDETEEEICDRIQQCLDKKQKAKELFELDYSNKY